MKINTIVADGLQLSKMIYEASQKRFYKISERLLSSKPPKMAALISSHRPDSDNFIQHQMKKYKEYGFELEPVEFNHTTSFDKLLHTIELLNKSKDIHGIQSHLPFPDHLKSHCRQLLDAMAFEKDVECLTTKRLDHMLDTPLDKPLSELDLIAPCTFLACLKVLEHYEVEVGTKEAVVLGNGYVSGCPVATMLKKKGASVTQCDRKTKNIEEAVQRADIIVSATGVPDPFCTDLVKPGAVVLDLGFCYHEGRLRGDIQSSALNGKASLVTPVPKGIGPITTAMVIRNLVLLWEASTKRSMANSRSTIFSSDRRDPKTDSNRNPKDFQAEKPTYSL